MEKSMKQDERWQDERWQDGGENSLLQTYPPVFKAPSYGCFRTGDQKLHKNLV